MSLLTYQLIALGLTDSLCVCKRFNDYFLLSCYLPMAAGCDASYSPFGRSHAGNFQEVSVTKDVRPSTWYASCHFEITDLLPESQL